jgi:hypothetical protein
MGSTAGRAGVAQAGKSSRFVTGSRGTTPITQMRAVFFAARQTGSAGRGSGTSYLRDSRFAHDGQTPRCGAAGNLGSSPVIPDARGFGSGLHRRRFRGRGNDNPGTTTGGRIAPGSHNDTTWRSEGGRGPRRAGRRRNVGTFRFVGSAAGRGRSKSCLPHIGEDP